MHTLRRAVLLAASLLALIPSAFAAEIAGRWKAEFDTMIGVQKYVFEFKVEGEKLTGKAIGTREGDTVEVVLTEGHVANDRITFVELLNYQGMDLRISYEGSLVSGDEIKLTRRVGDFAAEQLVAKRIK